MDQRHHPFLSRAVTGLVLAAGLLGAAGTLAAEPLGERLQRLFGSQPADPVAGILPVDEAFRFSVVDAGPAGLELSWQIADGYYLYRDKFAFEVLAGDVSIMQEDIEIPPGRVRHDESFGDVEVNTGTTSVRLPLQRRAPADRDIPVVLQVSYQGCKEDEVCFAPVRRRVSLTLEATDG